MSARSLTSILLLLNYLLVVGVGCMSRSGDQREFVRILISQPEQDYVECRYLRMDGLENFLTEALSSCYQDTAQSPKRHLISIVFGLDNHYLTLTHWVLSLATYRLDVNILTSYHPPVSAAVLGLQEQPPWIY